DDGTAAYLSGVGAINFVIAQADAEVSIAQTDAKKLSPELVTEIRSKVMREYGLEHLYLDEEAYNNMLNHPEKGTFVRKLIDSSGVSASQFNGRIRIDANTFAGLVQIVPEIREHIRIKTNGMTPRETLAA